MASSGNTPGAGSTARSASGRCPITSWIPTSTCPPVNASVGSACEEAPARPRRTGFLENDPSSATSPFGITQADGEKPFVLRSAVEQGLKASRLVRHQGLGEGIGQRIGHEHATAVQVAAEPAQRDLIHQRRREIGRGDQRRHQRQQEPQLQANCLQSHGQPSTPGSSGRPSEDASIEAPCIFVQI